MEVKRRSAGTGAAAASHAGARLRVRTLNSRQLLRGGEIEGLNAPAHARGRASSNATSKSAC